MPEIGSQRLYKCDVCGKVGPWGKGWSWKMKLHTRQLWDEMITVCSEECRLGYEVTRGQLTEKRRREGVD